MNRLFKSRFPQLRISPLYNRKSGNPVRFVTGDCFESAAAKELYEIGELIEDNADKIGLDSVDLNEGTLTIGFPRGTFVLNKHNASRQIWYSSPVSQPAYFDPIGNDGQRWWSDRISMTLRNKLKTDIRNLTGNELP